MAAPWQERLRGFGLVSEDRWAVRGQRFALSIYPTSNVMVLTCQQESNVKLRRLTRVSSDGASSNGISPLKNPEPTARKAAGDILNIYFRINLQCTVLMPLLCIYYSYMFLINIFCAPYIHTCIHNIWNVHGDTFWKLNYGSCKTSLFKVTNWLKRSAGAANVATRDV